MTWVGIPYKHCGRTIDGLDCWGLVRLVMQEECGIALDDHSDVSPNELIRVARRMKQGIASEHWQKVDQPNRHDVVILSHIHRRVPFHCGIMRDRRRMLHIWEKTDSVVMPLNHPMIENRIIGFYRHRELR